MRAFAQKLDLRLKVALEKFHLAVDTNLLSVLCNPLIKIERRHCFRHFVALVRRRALNRTWESNFAVTLLHSDSYKTVH